MIFRPRRIPLMTYEYLSIFVISVLSWHCLDIRAICRFLLLYHLKAERDPRVASDIIRDASIILHLMACRQMPMGDLRSYLHHPLAALTLNLLVWLIR